MTWKDFIPHPVKWLGNTCHKALELTGEQRQTLMSWGLLLGVVALTFVKVWAQRQMYAHWVTGITQATEDRLIDGLFSQLFWDTMLQAAFALGVVAIARGGSMLVSITKGGATVDFQASGSAASTLAKNTDAASAVTTTPTPPASPPGSQTTTTTTKVETGMEKPL